MSQKVIKSDMQLAAETSGLKPNWEKRVIAKCSGDYWYKDMVGQTVRIKHYGTFGVWDDQNRWYYFYDLS